MRKTILILGCIVILAAVLRFWQLGSNPPSLNWDEAAWGYNAYSLGIDGRDEFGVSLPYKYIESFGDFKPPLYAYLDVIPVKIFGLNEFAARFPSALFGTLTVILTYFLVLEVFRNKKSNIKKDSGQDAMTDKEIGLSPTIIELIALLAAFFTAVSPWMINLSRAAFEANVAAFFIEFGIYSFLVGMGKRKWFIVVSAVVFALSFYIFNTARVVSPILVIILAIGFWKTLLSRKVEVVVAGLVGIALIAPIATFLLSPQAALRYQEVNIFTDPNIVKTSNQEIANDSNAAFSKIIHNRRVLFTFDYLMHYFDNLNPSFLFIAGDPNARFSTKDIGEMYFWDIPFLIIGILLLFKKRVGYWWIIPLWLLAGIIPAAIAEQTPHALRIESSLPTFQIITAIGAAATVTWAFRQKKMVRNILIGMGSFALFLCIFYYLHGYYTFYPVDSSADWQYGYKEAVSYVDSVQNNYQKIEMTTELGRPYIYFLFYNKVNPVEYRNTAQITRDVFGFVHVNGFGKYEFRDSVQPVTGSNVLYLDIPSKLPDNAHIVKEFKLLNGSTVLDAYTI